MKCVKKKLAKEQASFVTLGQYKGDLYLGPRNPQMIIFLTMFSVLVNKTRA